MSQQHTTQASGQGMLERVFKLREHGTTARTEVIAGFTSFLTMVYIVFVNPQILGVAGMDTSAVFVTTCLIAAFGSFMMGLFANLPVALAPAMGLNAFFAFVVVQAMGLPWQVGMGAIFWGAICTGTGNGPECVLRFCGCAGDGLAVAGRDGRNLLGRDWSAVTDDFPRSLLDDC